LFVWGAKQILKKSQVTNFKLVKQFLRPRQSGAHGMSHACHTLDTPLHLNEKAGKTRDKITGKKRLSQAECMIYS